jgi:hypothetical protein
VSSGYFPGRVWVLKADVSEHCVGSIFNRWWSVKHSHFITCWRWNRHSVPKRRVLILRRGRGNTQKRIFHYNNTGKAWKLECYRIFYLSNWGTFKDVKIYIRGRNFGGLEVACWPLVPKFAGSHLAEAVGFLGRKKSSVRLPSEGEVKPSVPCRSLTACKRCLNVKCKSAFRQNYRTSLVYSSTFRRWVLSRGDTHGDAWWWKLERLTKIAQ